MYQVKEVNEEYWNKCYLNSHKSNLLQSWQYGNAKGGCVRWNVIRFVILNNGLEIAIAQAFIKKIPFLGGWVRVNRGPILMNKMGKEEYELTTLRAIASLLIEFQKKNLWLIKITPELDQTKFSHEFFKSYGLKNLKTTYQSGLIDLTISEDVILSNLKKKWRYYLNKGRKLEVFIEIKDGYGKDVEVLIDEYAKFQKQKNFSGITKEMILSLAHGFGSHWKFSLFIEYDSQDKKNVLGMLVSIRHGNTATYLIGLTSNLGREKYSNYVLLWNAIVLAKSAGCKWFDIGGLNQIENTGVAKFKLGLNSEIYNLSGEWVGILYPWRRRLKKGIDI
jgi:lipid II:glycine glycyltransferase (peptidoglycan interpeptide bridge formation enzyme)